MTFLLLGGARESYWFWLWCVCSFQPDILRLDMILSWSHYPQVEWTHDMLHWIHQICPKCKQSFSLFLFLHHWVYCIWFHSGQHLVEQSLPCVPVHFWQHLVDLWQHVFVLKMHFIKLQNSGSKLTITSRQLRVLRMLYFRFPSTKWQPKFEICRINIPHSIEKLGFNSNKKKIQGNVVLTICIHC